ncbi:hypothetical protein L226DRAFT_551619 [Lentinus tigrinus ALCF2SS1-7]|uniref:C2H2-type domain-containing protein n=1 Tax=Lentinus tigrinus ALCF2SS1-6 TaxID=1328759 RepID=A0A5C2SF72_9APHY|nr:hypothetical protein L227DRAFT_592445 [Lentinus tigrinus ALCF2SS1-6]RPD77845.1 hypothetical protein L226DRAFT_551619 [Lentinus tigrinus ALCF2SS1-7]
MSTSRAAPIDPAMTWLTIAAPQFHGEESESQPAVNYVRPETQTDDCDSDSSDSDAASEASDVDEDPIHPYNVLDTRRWINNGNTVYAADEGGETCMSPSHVADDAPYVPPATPGEDKVRGHAYLSPEDLAPSTPSPFLQPYGFRESSPQEQQAISPLALTSPLPSTSSPRYGSSRRISARRARTYVDPPSDDEFVESSASSEDEYVPSPKIRSRKLPSRGSMSSRTKARSVQRHSYSPYPSSSASTPSSIGESSSASASSGRRPGSRNVQIFNQPPPPRGSWSKTGPDAYKCPFCDHVQTNKRSPDMERHIRSHFRNAVKAQWVCCGVPVEEAAMYAVSASANQWTFNGRVMVGGCHEDFSRMDALKRHWKNSNNKCVGDIRYARVNTDYEE